MKIAHTLLKFVAGGLSLLCIGMTIATPIAEAHGPGDPWTAHYMWRRYFNTSTNCPNDAKAPEYECTGVLLRATSPQKEPMGAWVPEQKSYAGQSVSAGGVSFSYIRADSKFGKLAFSYTNGFTLYPYSGKYADPDPHTVNPTVLCAFPMDAATDNRVQAGCGSRSSSPQVGNPCQGVLETQDGWMQTFNANKSSPNHEFTYHIQCGFDMRDGHRQPDDFTTVLKLIKQIKQDPTQFGEVNELRVATWAPDANTAATQPLVGQLPIESFFYIMGTAQSQQGLANARLDQEKYFMAAARFVPIVRIKMPNNATEDFDFSYERADQSPNVTIPTFPTQDPMPCTKGTFDTVC